MAIEVQRADPAVRRTQEQPQQRAEQKKVQEQKKLQDEKLAQKKLESRDTVERSRDPVPKAPEQGAQRPPDSVPASSFQHTDFSAATAGARRPAVRSVDPIRSVDVGGERPNGAPTPAMRRTTEGVPEDFSAKGGKFLMQYTGAAHEGHFIKRMGEIGRKEGFDVVAAADTRDNADKLKKELGPDAKNVRVVQGGGYPWAEDSAHTKKDGSVTVNPQLRDPKATEQLRARLKQIDPTGDHSGDYKQLADKLRERNAAWGLNGAVGIDPSHAATPSMYSSLGQKVSTAKTYTEGGNVIHTTRGGEVHAIVGSESVSHNELLTGLKGDELKQAMAKDLGVKAENLHVVQQPGEFHLDMAMQPWGEGRMLLNDSKLAAEEQIKAQKLDPQRAAELRREAAARSVYEEQTKTDLEKAGFKVTSVPGRFFEGHHSNGEPKEITNFLNGEAGQNAKGGNYFITQRGQKELEDAFLSRLPVDVPARVYFAFDSAATRESLGLFGAANCLIKRFY